MAKIELDGPENFIVDAARPMMKVINELIDYPRVSEDVIKARKHIEKAMKLLNKAYSNLR